MPLFVSMPPPAALDIGFVGAGRLGTALAWGLARNGYRVLAVASRSRGSAARLASGIEGCRVVAGAQAVVDVADLVFVTVPDDAIEACCAAQRWREGQSVVHCSGATEISALATAAERGAMTGGFHPLQMFIDPETALRGLRGCTIAVEAAAPLFETLARMAEALGCFLLAVPPGKRALYHAGAGYAAAFINVLMAEALDILSPLGLPESQLVRALLPLMRGTCNSIERAGPAGGMAGPISRGDVGTVTRHLQALTELGPETLDLYRQLALRAVDLGIQRGSLDLRKARELRALLGKP